MQYVKGFLQDSRVEIVTDNMAGIGAWKNQGGRSGPLNGIMKEIFRFRVEYNIDLNIS